MSDQVITDKYIRDPMISQYVFLSDVDNIFGEMCSSPGERSILGGNGVESDCASCRPNRVAIWSV